MSIHVFGVRHLSPAGAWHLRHFLDERKPRHVLIEGLADAGELVKHIVGKGTRPPIAILAYTDSLPVRTLVYPLARYSPEYQAMKWAVENKAKVEFIDLPSSLFLGLQDQEIKRLESQKEIQEIAVPEPKRNLYDEIAAKSGEHDYDAFWERRFEHATLDGSYQRASFELGAALREEEDTTAWRAENLVREAYMRRRIAEVIKGGAKADSIVAVVGAFHAPVLNDHPPMTDEELAKLPSRSSKLTLMPYSYFKLSTQSGYGAGNKAPSYFELLGEHLNENTLTDFPKDYLTRVARSLRLHGTHRSTAEVIDGVRLAGTLAEIKHGLPTLRDLHDAAVTCLGHGEYSVVSEALARVDVGTAIGELPEGVSQTSIQTDFNREVERLKLGKYKTTVKQELSLDLRENRSAKTDEAAFADLNRSTFLHRLRVLEVPFAKHIAVKQDKQTFKENWTLAWSPESEIALVEAVLLGETVELACGFKIDAMLKESATIADAAKLIAEASLCNLAAAMDRARSRVQELAAQGSEFAPLAAAALQLSTVIRYGTVRKFDAAPLVPLMQELFVQAALALFGASTCDNAAAAVIAVGMDDLNRVALEHHDAVEEPLWIDALQKLAAADDRNPLLSGIASAILLERGLMPNEELVREVSRRLSPGIAADLGAGWFEGLSRRNRYSLLARQPLWEALAGYISSLDDDQFRRALVFLRRAFGNFSPGERRTICENLGQFWGLGAEEASEHLEAVLSEKEEEALQDLNDMNFDDL